MKILLATLLCALVSSLASASTEAWAALQRGGVVLMLRHAQTEPGVGDPAGYRLDDCSTQRQLSAAGRAQARAFGERLRARGVRIASVASSAWCRSRDTATLTFPAETMRHFAALDSFFDRSADREASRDALLDAATGLPRSGVTVWVSHQVNITALTGEVPAMGEGIVLQPEGRGYRVIGRVD